MVGRNEFALWWTVDAALVPALSELNGGGFQVLAAAIVDLDFKIGGVAAIDLTNGAGFVSGSAVLVSGNVQWDGSTAGTWIEKRLHDTHNFAVNATIDSADEHTNLVAGVVRGGGFVLGNPELDTMVPTAAPIQESVVAPGVDEAPAEQVAPEIEEQGIEAVPSTNEATDTNEPMDASETLIIPSMPPSVVIEPEPPTDAPPEPIIAKVEFDDGREVAVNGGLIVGRNPAGGDVPIGFTSVTVLGEFISRRHWQLDLRNRSAELRDLGSASGTIVEAGGATIRLGPNEMTELPARSRVLFADHWATVTVRPA